MTRSDSQKWDWSRAQNSRSSKSRLSAIPSKSACEDIGSASGSGKRTSWKLSQFSNASQPNAPARVKTVALVGNPNSGKTTLFNAITGARQRVGNYPGVTVEKISAKLNIGDEQVEFVDVPGLYSLSAISEDERVAVEALDSNPDLVVCVVDAHNLERNLFLISQITERGLPVVVALSMTDLVESAGGKVDVPRLANLLGTDVVPVVAHKRRGIRELLEVIETSLEHPAVRSEISVPTSAQVRAAGLRERLLRLGYDIRHNELQDWIEGKSDELTERIKAFPEIYSEFHTDSRHGSQEEDLPHTDTTDRYAWAAMVQRAVYSSEEGKSVLSLSDRIDRFLINRVFGFALFVLLMYGVFQSIYTLSGPLMDGIDWVFGWIGDRVAPMLESSPVLKSAIVDGLIGGIGAVLVFLPQILILFFFIAVLEGTGYLARAAFLMDRLLGWCGLNGRAFIPLLSSFACAIPGVMAARVIPDSRSRLATILVAPLMSCSARLPVYVLMIGTFIEPRYGPLWSGFALFAMHFLGVLVAVPIVWLFNSRLLRGKRLPFLLELPPYQWPKWRDVFLAMYLRAKVFVTVAGTTIVVLSVLIWALLYFPRSAEADSRYASEFQSLGASAPSSEQQFIAMKRTENSFLGRFGKSIEPIFAPAGFDWRISTAILAAFPAREVVVPTLGIIFSLGDDTDETSDDLRSALRNTKGVTGKPIVSTSNAIGLMVFFALCAQCFSTLAVVKRETNSIKWPIFMFIYMTSLAYIGAVLVHQIGKLFE